MSNLSRIDRLFLLVESGDSVTVRHKAAEQLGVVVQTQPAELPHLLRKVHPLLGHRAWATRTAAGQVVAALARQFHSWDPPGGDCEWREDPASPLHAVTLASFQWTVVLAEGARLFKEGPEVRHRHSLGFPYAKQPVSNIAPSASMSPPPATASRLHALSVGGEQKTPSPRELRIMNMKAKKQLKQRTPVVVKPAPINASPVPSTSSFIAPPATTAEVQVKQEGMPATQTTDWPFKSFCELLFQDMFSAAWEKRHGATLAFRELFKYQGEGCGKNETYTEASNDRAHRRYLELLTLRVTSLMCLERMFDFAEETGVAPVLETAAQVVAVLYPLLSQDHIRQTVRVLMGMASSRLPEWQVPLCGFLGLKYLFGQRSDMRQELLNPISNVMIEALPTATDETQAAVAAGLFELLDYLPVEKLEAIAGIVWQVLPRNDETSGSTAPFLDLLASIIGQPWFLTKVSETNASALYATRIASLWPFMRHVLTGVRLAMLRTLSSIFQILEGKSDILNRALIDTSLHYLWQNLLLETEEPNLYLTVALWDRVLCLAKEGILFPQGIPASYIQLLSTPLGSPLNEALLFTLQSEAGSAADTKKRVLQDATESEAKRRRTEKTRHALSHNTRHEMSCGCDQSMVLCDLAVLEEHVVQRNRIVAAQAFGRLCASVPGTVLQHMVPAIRSLLQSPCALHQMIACFIIESCCAAERSSLSSPGLLRDSRLLALLVSLACSQAMPQYAEMSFQAQVVHADARSMVDLVLRLFGTPALEQLGIAHHNHVSDVQHAHELMSNVTEMFLPLVNPASEEFASLNSLILQSDRSIALYDTQQSVLNTRIRGAAAMAYLEACGDIAIPEESLVLALLNAVQAETLAMLQARFALGVVRLSVLLVIRPVQFNKHIIQSLLESLMCERSSTPTLLEYDSLDQIYTVKLMEDAAEKNVPKRKPTAGRRAFMELPEEQATLSDFAVAKRGSKETFRVLCAEFGTNLFDRLPALREAVTLPLQFSSPASIDISNEQSSKVIYALEAVTVLSPFVDATLMPQFSKMYDAVVACLSSKWGAVRHAAAKCIASLAVRDLQSPCNILPRFVQEVLPSLAETTSPQKRQGIAEAIYCVVAELGDARILPYLVFFMVPVMSRMSDSDRDVRWLMNSTFAELVRLMPLESSAGDPPHFSPVFLERNRSQRQFIEQLHSQQKVPVFTIPVHIKAELRNYQKDGVNWMAFLRKYGLHGILCDDMGLGKTLQTICIIASDIKERRDRYTATQKPDFAPMPSLIVAPTTLMEHWKKEITKFVDDVQPYVLRQIGQLKSAAPTHDVIIVSYEFLRSNISVLSKQQWNYCVLDEGHVIKNAKSKLSLAIRNIRAEHRLILSGTPIQNHVLDLWSLFDFLMPGFLGSEQQFNERYSRPIVATRGDKATKEEQQKAAQALEALHKQVLPFILRRMKTDVLDDLPDKIIQDTECDLSAVQHRMYQLWEKAQAALDTKRGLELMIEARLICNHPKLFLKLRGDRYPEICDDPEIKSADLADISISGKMDALRELLLECGIGTDGDRASDDEMDAVAPHRLLIFAQSSETLGMIEEDLFKRHMPNVTHLRLDAAVKVEQRQVLADRFNDDPSIDCLLLTTKVGAYGLNLTGADTVIFVDHDYNPTKDQQAMDRAHRIGQKRVVNVYRIITRGTFEERIMSLQRFKQHIANSVINEQNLNLETMQTDSVMDLLHYGGSALPTEAASPSSALRKDKGKAPAVHRGHLAEEAWVDDDYGQAFAKEHIRRV